jgi:hypothetical protein
MREVLYDVEWQRLRISLLQARRDDGGWSSLTGMHDNLRHLDMYLNEVPSSTGEYELRKYRINNALNAVVMGYNGQGADDSLIEFVRSFRVNKAAGADYGTVKTRARFWQWDSQLRQLIELYKEDKEEFEFLQENLLGRSKNGTKQTRPALYKFLDLMKTASRT